MRDRTKNEDFHSQDVMNDNVKKRSVLLLEDLIDIFLSRIIGT